MGTKKQKAEGVKSSSAKTVRKTSQEEQDSWDALYMYIKNDILEMDPKLHLNHYTIMRLKGMAQGCFIGKDRAECDLTYGYRVVLAAFYKAAPLLKTGFKLRTFNDLQHKINWMMSVVEPNLNEVYIEEESERKRIESLQQQTNNVYEDINRYQQTNKYINSSTEFKEAKTWDKKHKDMW